MRITGIAFFLLLIAVCAYAYTHNPAGCVKLGNDLVAVFQPPTTNDSAATPPVATPPPIPATAPVPPPSSTESLLAPMTYAPPPPVKPWSPPAVMPAQSNWTWTTSDGKTYQNVVITNIGPEIVSINHSMGVAHISIAELPGDIQKQLNYDPEAAHQIPSLVSDKLITAADSPAGALGTSIQYYALYYSAQWCPPCHAFTPHLVKWYNLFKPNHPNFELIFVSEDHTENDMLAYMKEMAMPWPAVRYSDLLHDGTGTFQGSGIEKFAGAGIPDLVLVDVNGHVLSDSYRNGTYVGPEAVVDDINKLVGGTSPAPLVRRNSDVPAVATNDNY
jgi:thiol-disulfide isomerase/thioredoxin